MNVINCCVAVTQFIHTPPSVIASACVAAAAQGLNVGSSVTENICTLTNCSADTVKSTMVVIEGQLEREMSKFKSLGTAKGPTATAASTPATKHVSSQDDDDMNRQPETPTDIQEIHF